MLDLALHALQIAALVWLYREVRRLRRQPTPATPGAQEVIDRLRAMLDTHERTHHRSGR